MYKVNDVTNWLSQTTDNSKYFVCSPGLWDKESRLYIILPELEHEWKFVMAKHMKQMKYINEMWNSFNFIMAVTRSWSILKISTNTIYIHLNLFTKHNSL